MEYFRESKYPNGWIKSRLYEVFLTRHDFGIGGSEYDENIEFIKIDERNRVQNCTWFRDAEGRLLVAEVQFKDRGLGLAITEGGFEFVHKPSSYDQISVFISYAREDSEFANRLYNDLRREGFNPWLDKEDLLPGEQWEIRIQNAIRESRFFIALLSSRSVKKWGYVQKEIGRALQFAEEIPENEIFFIPARLDDCRPSHSALSKYNRVDLFPDWNHGIQRILVVLKSVA